MQPILDVVQEGIGNTPCAPACAVFGAASYLLQACEKVSEAYDGVFEQIGNITTRLREYEYSSTDEALKVKMTNILAFILDIFGKTEACIRRKRFKQWARAVFLQEDDIQSSISRLHRYIETELGLVIALTYGRVKDLQSTTSVVQTQVDSVAIDVKDIINSQRNDRQRAFSESDEKKLSDCLKLKSVDDNAREHAANIERLTKGTGDWIRTDPMFRDWQEAKAPVL